MTARQQAVLDETSEVSRAPLINIDNDKWLRPFHVRFYRGERTNPIVRALTIEQVDATMRGLAAAGKLVKRDRSTQYRIVR